MNQSRGLTRVMAILILLLFFILFIVLLYVFRPKLIGVHALNGVKFTVHILSGGRADMGINLLHSDIKYSQGVVYPLPVTTYKDDRHRSPVSIEMENGATISSCGVTKEGEVKVESSAKHVAAIATFPSLGIEPPKCGDEGVFIKYEIVNAVHTVDGQKVFRHQLKPVTGMFGFKKAEIELKTIDPLAYLKPKIDVYTFEDGKRKRITGKLKVVGSNTMNVELEKPLYADQEVWFEVKWIDPRAIG